MPERLDQRRYGFSSVEIFSAAISFLSVLIAVASFMNSMSKDSGEELTKATREWQKGFIFGALNSAKKPMSIDEIEAAYRSEATKVREKYHLTDKNFSSEEIYGLLIEMAGTQAIKMPEINHFSVRTDDDATLDRRMAFDMLQFARANEYKYSYSEFALEFANWQLAQRQVPVTKDKALSVLLIAMQNSLVGMVPKPGDTIKCLGEVKPLFIASMFELRSRAPIALPMPGAALQPCHPESASAEKGAAQ